MLTTHVRLRKDSLLGETTESERVLDAKDSDLWEAPEKDGPVAPTIEVSPQVPPLLGRNRAC